MKVCKTIGPLRKEIRQLRMAGNRIGFVPTMGALHKGHRSLIAQAKKDCDTVTVSIFVNPTQFAPNEDLDAYPRPVEKDLDCCRRDGVDLVFLPAFEDMYPADATPAGGSLSTVKVKGLSEKLCGRSRPVHFEGVATIVAKLLNIVAPDAAYFGWKDAQQATIIKRMVRDLNFPVEIRCCPTVREPSGLALSSRNTYLDPARRQQAAVLADAMNWAAGEINAGRRKTGGLIAGIARRIRKAIGCRIEYIAVHDPDTLDDVDTITGPVRIALAVHLAGVRLIDNLWVDIPRDKE